jgi:hypothetical protein
MGVVANPWLILSLVLSVIMIGLSGAQIGSYNWSSGTEIGEINDCPFDAEQRFSPFKFSAKLTSFVCGVSESITSSVNWDCEVEIFGLTVELPHCSRVKAARSMIVLALTSSILSLIFVIISFSQNLMLATIVTNILCFTFSLGTVISWGVFHNDFKADFDGLKIDDGFAIPVIALIMSLVLLIISVITQNKASSSVLT